MILNKVPAAHSGLLSLWERIKVRACHGQLDKPGTLGKQPHLRRGCSGVSCTIGGWAGSSSAVSTRSGLGSSTSIARKRSSGLNSTAAATAMLARLERTLRALQSCTKQGSGSSAFGTQRFSPTLAGCSTRSSTNSIRRNRAGRSRSCPHLNPLPRGEETARSAIRSSTDIGNGNSGATVS